MNSAKAFPLAMDNSTTYMMCYSLLLVNLSTCTCKLIFSVNSKPNCLSNRAFSSDLQGPFEKQKTLVGSQYIYSSKSYLEKTYFYRRFCIHVINLISGMDRGLQNLLLKLSPEVHPQLGLVKNRLLLCSEKFIRQSLTQ